MAQFDYLQGADFLRATVHGDIDRAASLRLLHEVLQRLADAHAQGVLLDVRDSKAKLSYADLYYLAAEIFAARISPPTRIAMVHDLDEDIEKVRFFELTARNRGLQVELFTDPAPAAHWLDHHGAAR